MKLVAIVAVLALLAITALADVCSDGSCTSTVSVSQTFDSVDCSGEPTLALSTNYTDPCISDDDEGYNRTVTFKCSSNGGFSTILTPDTTSCSKNSKSSTTLQSVGVCTQIAAARSRILWCNQASISNNFKASKNATTDAAVTMAVFPCNITTGCTGRTGTLRTFNEPTCNVSMVNEVYPASALNTFAIDVDVCYATNSSYLKRAVPWDDRKNVIATCKNGQYVVSYLTGGCGASANHLYSIAYPTDTCIRYGYNTWISFTCPSAASNLVAGGSLMIALLLIALLFI